MGWEGRPLVNPPSSFSSLADAHDAQRDPDRSDDERRNAKDGRDRGGGTARRLGGAGLVGVVGVAFSVAVACLIFPAFVAATRPDGSSLMKRVGAGSWLGSSWRSVGVANHSTTSPSSYVWVAGKLICAIRPDPWRPPTAGTVPGRMPFPASAVKTIFVGASVTSSTGSGSVSSTTSVVQPGVGTYVTLRNGISVGSSISSFTVEPPGLWDPASAQIGANSVKRAMPKRSALSLRTTSPAAAAGGTATRIDDHGSYTIA